MEGDQRSLGAVPIVSVLLQDDRRQQREVQRVGSEIPHRGEPDALVDLADSAALGDVGGVDLRPTEAQEIDPLLPEQPILYLGITQQVSRLRDGPQVSLEGGHQRLSVLLEAWAQRGEQLAVIFRIVEIGDLSGEVVGHLAPKVGFHATLSMLAETGT